MPANALRYIFFLVKYSLRALLRPILLMLPSIKLLHRDSILLARYLFRHPRLPAIKIVPGWQKLRHASLSSALVAYHHSQDALSASVRLSNTNALYCRAVRLKFLTICS
jgi:hypothetical protein